MLVLTGCQASETIDAKPQAADPSARARAVEQVLSSARSEDPFLRANALEAAQHLGDAQRVQSLVHMGLSDAHEAVRFTAVVLAGRLKLAELAPALERLLQDPSPSVYAATLFSLRECGRAVDISPLAALIRRPDPTLRGNIAMLLGQMGDASAVDLLKDIARQPPAAGIEPVERAVVKIQIAEALVRLGDESGRADIRAGLYHSFDEVRIMSARMLGELNDREFRQALRALLNKDPLELRLAAAESLARLGHGDGLTVALRSAEHDLPHIRYQAAMTLAQFRDSRAAAARQGLLADGAEQVRIAAAAAVLQAR